MNLKEMQGIVQEIQYSKKLAPFGCIGRVDSQFLELAEQVEYALSIIDNMIDDAKSWDPMPGGLDMREQNTILGICSEIREALTGEKQNAPL